MVTNFSDQGAGGWKPELRKAAEVEARRLSRSCAKRRKGCRKVVLWLEEVTGSGPQRRSARVVSEVAAAC